MKPLGRLWDVIVGPRSQPKAEGKEAVQEAEQHLHEHMLKWPEVARVATSMRQMRVDNHFTERIRDIFEGGEK